MLGELNRRHTRAIPVWQLASRLVSVPYCHICLPCRRRSGRSITAATTWRGAWPAFRQDRAGYAKSIGRVALTATTWPVFACLSRFSRPVSLGRGEVRADCGRGRFLCPGSRRQGVVTRGSRLTGFRSDGGQGDAKFVQPAGVYSAWRGSQPDGCKVASICSAAKRSERLTVSSPPSRKDRPT